MKKQYQEEKTCACCGKTMYVLHPSRWAYKKKKGKEPYTWYCSWKCMRKDETMERRLTQENYDKAVEMAIRGEDYLAYLKKCGAKNPSATWCYIKKKLAETHPQKLEMLPEKNWARIEDKQAAKKKEKKKPQLAEVVMKLPEEKEETATMEMTDEHIEWKKTKGGITAKTRVDKDMRMEISVEKEPEKLDVMSLKSRVLGNAFFTRKLVAIEEDKTVTKMALEEPATILNLGVKPELDRKGWYQLIDEIKMALDQMKI